MLHVNIYDVYDVYAVKMPPKSRKRYRSEKKKSKSVEEPVMVSEDSMSPTRKSSRISKKKDDIITPEKVPVEVSTPRKSRRSKDLSPPPLKHRQNRMPEQVALIRGNSKLFLYKY